MQEPETGNEQAPLRQDRSWRDNGWTAQGVEKASVSPGLRLTQARALAWAEAGSDPHAAR